MDERVDETDEVPAHRRRLPKQERSRRRVEAVLGAAHELVVEHGSEALTMTEVAARAGVSIGSVYQYFPDKPAILRELALRIMERVHHGLVDALAGIDSAPSAVERVDATLATYHEMFLSEPGIRDIWAATQSDKELQRLDLEDSRDNGRAIARALTPFVARRDRDRLEVLCLLHAHLAGSAARLALAVGGDEGRALMVEFRRSVRHDLDALLVEPRRRS